MNDNISSQDNTANTLKFSWSSIDPSLWQIFNKPTTTQPIGTLEFTSQNNQALDSPFNNNKLTVYFGDLQLQSLIQNSPDLSTLEINNVPGDVQIRFWADQNGYFFWFQNSPNSTERYYFPSSLKTIDINGQPLNLDIQKLQVNEAMMQTNGGFSNFSNTTNALTYFSRMSKLSQSALSIEDTTLSQSAQNSNNPYFKIYLADVDTALAMQPVINQVMSNGTATLNNPQTLSYINQAISLLQQAQSDSINSLSPYNEVPPQNINMPMDPYGLYMGGSGSPYYYGFWGGSLQQARYREVALTFLKGLIQSNALPSLQLPPALPPG